MYNAILSINRQFTVLFIYIEMKNRPPEFVFEVHFSLDSKDFLIENLQVYTNISVWNS